MPLDEVVNYGVLGEQNGLRHITLRVTVHMRFRSFADRQTRKVWDGWLSRKLPADIQRVARRKLRMLNNAQHWTGLQIPSGNRLERLKGGRRGQ